MSLQPVTANNKDLGFSRYKSNLKFDYAAGVTTIELWSISQFAINQVLLFGEFGSEGSEIIKTHSVTAPSGETITLASGLAKPHPKETPVYIIPFDQIEFYHSATLDGSKTLLGTSPYNIDPEQDEMLYEDISNTSGYYFTRYKNSITSNYSDFSDGIPYDGLPENTVGYCIDVAMNELHQKFDEQLTFGMMIGFLREMLRLIRGKLKSWGKYQEYDYVIGQASAGVRRWAMPESIYDKNTGRSILSVRIGKEFPLTKIDRMEYLEKMNDTAYTEVNTQAAIAATSLILDDTDNLSDEGSIDVYVSGIKQTITYTGNNRSTNTLSGIPSSGTGSITAIIPVDSQVWQGMTTDTPSYYAVWDGYIYITPITSEDLEGRDIFMDFYTDIENINSQMDVLLGVKFDCAIPYLKFKIRAIRENNGEENLKDSSYILFRELLTDAIKNDAGGEIEAFRPRSRGSRTIRYNHNIRG